MENINKKLFLLINNLSGNIILDNFFIFVAKYMPFIFAFLLIILYFANKKDKSLFALYSGILGLLINFIISIFYFHPRPFMVGIGNTLIYHKPETSFPSDHATLCFSIAFSFIFFQEKIIGIILLILSIILGFSRVYVGVHFPFDIIGSIIVSIISLLVIKIFSNKLIFMNKLIKNLERLFLQYLYKKLSKNN